MLRSVVEATIILGLVSMGVCEAADSVADMAACRAIADPAARLACFDHAAATPSGGAGTATAATAAAAPASEPPPAPLLTPQQQFGLPERAVVAQEVAAGTRSADANKVDATVTKVVTAADRRQVYTFDNGQVWRQLTHSGDILAKAGDAATISRGLLGSYWLQIKGGRGCKVSRLQ
jgi:hypothetical protein